MVVIPNTDTPERRKFFINSVTLCAYDAADVMNNDSYAIVLESFVNISSLWVIQVNTKNVPLLDLMFLSKKWSILPPKAHNTICHTTQCDVHTICINPCLGSSRQMIINCGTEDYHIMCTVIHCLPLKCLGEAISVHRYLALTLVDNVHSQWS